MKCEFTHACIRVLDLQKSLDFYEKALGLKEVRRKEFPDFTLVYLTDGVTDFELELTYNHDQKEPYVIGNGFSHLAVYVDNLEELFKKHKEMGFEVSDLKGLPGEPPRYYFLTDPDGYRTEILRKDS